ncbi:caspase family protein [Sandaracinus amylolyticus]|uniref:caspase family protein n=1 Tax=Sandaracinus amylolyticus TaxID=927083 RepID=UPI001F2AB634|nr:caspase family protein [Sandaracinus amylolyticus]UJR79221.1 Pre-peptidase C-terminal domain-containing protein [Sandaracinus amylolyticus]
MHSLVGRASALASVFLVVACGSRGDAGSPPPPPTPPVATAPTGDVLLDRDGALEPTDTRGTISFVDRFDVPVAPGEHVRVTLTSSAFDPVLEVTPPRGAPLTNDDLRGDRTRSEIELVATEAGALKVQVTSFAPSAQGAYHVHVARVRVPSTPAAPAVAAAEPTRRHHVLAGVLSSLARPPQTAARTPMPLRVGDRASGTLAAGDTTLDSGELADVYVLDVSAATDLTIQMQSTTLDAYLVVRGPGDREWENDDSGGTRDASVSIPQAAPGQYRVFATTFRAGMTGAYELKVLSARDAASAGTTAAAEQVIAGELATGDRTLVSGELVGEHRFTWPVGTGVHLEARSSAFDTYLILHTPGGQQRDNDDQSPGVLNAAMDFVVQEPGEHRVLVTSYRPGETGRYELVVRGGGTATPPSAPPPTVTSQPSAPAGQPIRGALAAGDATLSSGEFADTHRMTFTAGQPVSIRVESSAFDTYLIVRSPSGRQQDNDDVSPGVLNSGIDIPAAEAGEYQVIVTSYRPGETGAYVLTTSAGTTTTPQPGPGTPPAAPGVGSGSRVWVLSVGISDYPGGANDLPECANDAVKIAEALRNQGLTAPDREFLLTDGRATTAAIRDAMQRITAQIRPDDTFVFFYSGHGGQNESRSGDSRELDAIDEYLFVHDGPLLDDELGRLMDGVRARTALVAIDACFAGGFAKDVITRPGVVGLFSSEEDVTSAVASQFQAGGYLSHFLRLGIQGEADHDPRDRVMTVGELTHYVWQQYGRHASDVRMGMGYQQLVVDRGAVRATQELWRNNR